MGEDAGGPGRVRRGRRQRRRPPNPELTLDRLVEEGDTVAVVGHGRVVLGEGDPVDFVYSEVFTFADDLIRRLDTFHVWLGDVPA